MIWVFQWFLTFLHPGKGSDLLLENLALRQQLAILKRQRPRPRFRAGDRAFWIALRQLWPQWQSACLVMQPATVVAWHRAGFRAFWRWKSRGRPGRHPIPREWIALIRRMALENPTWGAPRIHGELHMLGLRISQATVSRRMPKPPRDPKRAQGWKAFLRNHREHIAAMDFFTVPTATFGQLYGLVILHHGRRAVAHVHVTAHPTAEWVRQQLREAFPGNTVPRYLIFDRDAIFGATQGFIRNLGIEPKRIGFRSPWQNGVVERFMGTLRREVLDHVIARNEAHLLRLLKEFVTYYHEDRTHLGLKKETPLCRIRDHPPKSWASVIASPRLGGLHHRYQWGAEPCRVGPKRGNKAA